MVISMSTTDALTALNIIVAIIGVLFVMFAAYEVFSLRQLKKDFHLFRSELAAEHYKHQQAAHKIIASYGIKDPSSRITLITQAVSIDPSVYNGFNSLGYAFIESGDLLKATDAFQKAIQYHPEDKAGYFDLAFAYLQLEDKNLCKQYLLKAIEIDPSSKDDIDTDTRFSSII